MEHKSLGMKTSIFISILISLTHCNMNTLKNRLISDRFSKNNASEVQNKLSPIQKPIVRTVGEKILNGDYTLIDYDCVCGEGGGTIISEIERYGLNLKSVLCSKCGTIRISPFPDEKSITDFYSNYYQDMYQRSTDVEAYYQRQKMYGYKFLSITKSFLQNDDYIFELGCGAGGALEVFKDYGYKVAGADYDKRLLGYGQHRGHNLFYGDAEALKVLKAEAKLIFSNHVFEHITDPLKTLIACKEMLSDNGRIIHAVPNIYKCRNNDAYEGDILQMMHISHVYNYTIEGLSMMAGKAGLSVTQIFPSHKLKTPTSRMAEMWVEMVRSKRHSKNYSINPEKKIKTLQRQEKAFKMKNSKSLYYLILRILKWNISFHKY